MKSSPRRSPSFVGHQLDLKKLFTEGESGQLPRPSNPRRPSVLHSSSTQESSRSASIPATLEQGTAETDNHQAEEKQQRKPRQSQMNTSQGPASPKRVTSGKRPTATNDIETDFDGSELVPSRFDGARKDAYKQDEKEFKQPKQPKKERSLAGHGNEVRFTRMKCLSLSQLLMFSLRHHRLRLNRIRPFSVHRRPCFLLISKERTTSKIC